MTEKISLTQQDEPSVSTEIFACTMSWLSQSRSRRSPAAAALSAPGMLSFLPGTSGFLVPSRSGSRDAWSPQSIPWAGITPQGRPVLCLPLALSRGGEQPTHLGARGGVSVGKGEHHSALHPTAWQKRHDSLQAPEQSDEPGALLFTAVALQLLPQPLKHGGSHSSSSIVALKHVLAQPAVYHLSPNSSSDPLQNQTN